MKLFQLFSGSTSSQLMFHGQRQSLWYISIVPDKRAEIYFVTEATPDLGLWPLITELQVRRWENSFKSTTDRQSRLTSIYHFYEDYSSSKNFTLSFSSTFTTACSSETFGSWILISHAGFLWQRRIILHS